MKPTSRSHPNRFSKKGRFFFRVCFVFFCLPASDRLSFRLFQDDHHGYPRRFRSQRGAGRSADEAEKVHSVDTPVGKRH